MQNEPNATIPGVSRLLSLETVAVHLQVSRAQAYRLARSGQIPARRLGALWRVSEADLKAFCGPLTKEPG